MTRTLTPASLLRDLLEEKDVTQKQLSDLTGIDRSKVNGYATGREPLGPGNAGRIEDALGVERGYLGVTRKRVARDETLWEALETLAERVAAIEAKLP